MSCDRCATALRSDCEEGANDSRTGANDSRTGGAGGVAMALRALESPDWPQLTLAVLGRNGTRREVVQRLAAMLDQRAGRDGREKPDGDADTGKRGLTEREREILDMWPRFEDGEPVWIGDDVSRMDVRSFVFTESGAMVTNLTSVPAYGECRKYGEPFKRPAPEVLDADGVEIEVGDTVYALRMYGDTGFTVSRFAKNCDGDTIVMVEEMGSGLFPKTVTHTRPDSWELLESDAALSPADYVERRGLRTDLYAYQEMPIDLVRRAKALAGVEVEA